MIRRWLSYLAVWFLCLILFLLTREWACAITFAALSLIPPLSLLLSRSAIRTARVSVLLPKAVIQGQPCAVCIGVDCRGPKPQWLAKLSLTHSFTGEQKKLKDGDSLPAAHCGTLRIRIGSVYMYDYMGLFRFRLAHPSQLDIPVRPEPAAPQTLPELGDKAHTRWQPRKGGGFSENHDLRLYRPGDSLQQIHWKLSAKAGNLILREPLEPLHSRLLLRMDLKGTTQELDDKLSQLLWLSRYLLEKKLPHHWQVLTAAGIREFYIPDEKRLYACLDGLLNCPPALSGTVLETQTHAAWWYYIGGDTHEEG